MTEYSQHGYATNEGHMGLGYLFKIQFAGRLLLSVQTQLDEDCVHENQRVDPSSETEYRKKNIERAISKLFQIVLLKEAKNLNGV